MGVCVIRYDCEQATLSFGRVDTPRDNGIVYPRAVVEQMLADYQKYIEAHTSFGILWDRGDPYPPRRHSIDEVSHHVVKAEIIDDYIIMTIQVSKTSQGQHLQRALYTIRDLPEKDRSLFNVTGDFFVLGQFEEGVAQPGMKMLYTTICIEGKPQWAQVGS